jgi:hypothetical protein
MPIAPQLKRMFLSERTMIHMRWHKNGERENKDVMVQPSDSDVWKTLDNFDPEFAQRREKCSHWIGDGWLHNFR